MQHSGHRGQHFSHEKTIKVHLVGPNEICGKYKVRTMAKSLLKHHCYCPIIMMRSTKTAFCLQTMTIFHPFYGL